MSESRVVAAGAGTTTATTTYGPWSPCVYGYRTRKVIQANGTVTEETESCTTGTTNTGATYGPWSTCEYGYRTRKVIQANGTVTEETESCTTGTTQAAGTTQQEKAYVGGSGSHPASTFPWGTVLVIGGVLAAGGAAAWEIEAHRQVRAVKG